MYLKRNIESQLINWIKRDDKKPLVILGTRQCGKSTTTLKITKEYYKNVYYVNFMRLSNNPLFQEFKTDPTLENLILFLERSNNQEIVIDKDSVIVIDELQECLGFYTQLKFINEDNMFKNIICLGSYLSMKVFTDKITVPVGQVHTINMYTLSFDEFLMNASEVAFKNLVKASNSNKIDDSTHNYLCEWFYKYIVVGGFPEAVKVFLQNNENYDLAKEVNEDIYNKYYADIGKYLEGNDKLKAMDVFENAISFSSRESNTFTLSTIKTSARYRDYEYAIQLLVKSHICYKIDNCQNLNYPLKPKDGSSKFKIYLCDIGLISCKHQLTIDNIKTPKFNNIKGHIMENYVISELIKNNKKPYYYTYYINTNGYELDCVYEDNLEVNVLEIKSGKNIKSKSLDLVKEKKDISLKTVSLLNELNDKYIPLYLFSYMTNHQ